MRLDAVEQNERRNGAEHSIRPFCIDNVFTFLHQKELRAAPQPTPPRSVRVR